MVDFDTVPISTLVPWTFVEIANQAQLSGPTIQPYLACLIGQKIAAGGVAELVPTRLTSSDQALTDFGEGSQLHRMSLAWFSNNKTTEVWAVAIDDQGSAVSATGTLIVTGTATVSGTLVCYCGGVRFEASVSVGDTATVVGAAIVAALPSYACATAANSTGTVTFTAKNGGVVFNGIDLRVSYGRTESTPRGLTVAESDIGSPIAGTLSIDIDEVWPFIASQHFNVIVSGANEAANTAKIITEMTDRYGPDRNLEGTVFIGNDDTIANQTTFAAAIDSKFIVSVGVEDSPTPWFEIAAAAAAVAAGSLAIDPARPLQTLQLVGVRAPAATDLWTHTEQDTLLGDGVALVAPDASGRMRVVRMVTTYLTNAVGAADVSFRDLMVLATLSYMRYDLRTQFAAKFPRHKLASDATVAGAGQKIVTPAIARAFLYGIGETWVQLLILDDLEAWKSNVVAEINPSDPNRLDIRVAPDLVNQLRVTALRLEFRV